MHALHAILVRVSAEDYTDLDGLKEEAKYIAMQETEHYYGFVYDWRTEGPGGWSKEYPDVVVGKEDPERFLAELEKFSQIPLEEALQYLEFCKNTNYRWRTEDELKADPELVVLPSPKNGEDNLYWSGKPVPEITINEKTVKNAWENEHEATRIYTAIYALRLVTGEYLHASCFYSVPDGCAKLSQETLQEVKKNPSDYALVFSDYHY